MIAFIIIFILFILAAICVFLSDIPRNKFRIISKIRKDGSGFYTIERLKGVWLFKDWYSLYCSEKYEQWRRFGHNGSVTRSPYPNGVPEWNTPEEANDYLKEIADLIKGNAGVIKEIDL